MASTPAGQSATPTVPASEAEEKTPAFMSPDSAKSGLDKLFDGLGKRNKGNLTATYNEVRAVLHGLSNGRDRSASLLDD